MTVVGYAVAMATGAKQCECGKALRSDNTTGLCQRCLDRHWYRNNREQAAAEDRARIAANPEKKRASEKAWRESNRDKRDSYDLAREARKRDMLVEEVRRFVVLARDRGRCHLCLKQVDPQKWHLDHVISTAQGGPHCYANTAVSHPACNMRKGDSSRSSDPARWAEATAAYSTFHGKEYPQ